MMNAFAASDLEAADPWPGPVTTARRVPAARRVRSLTAVYRT